MKNNTAIKRDFYLIETMAWLHEASAGAAGYRSGFLFLDMHLERLKRSALFFGFNYPEKRIKKSLEGLSSRLSRRVFEKTMKFKVRCVLHPSGLFEATNVDEIQDVPAPVGVDISSRTVDHGDIFLYHKTSRRELFDGERRRLEKAGIFETVFLNTRRELTQGTITNLFLDMGGQALLTPALTCGLLPGILRQALIEEGRAREAFLVLDDLKKARSLFVGNSVRGLLRAEIRLQ